MLLRGHIEEVNSILVNYAFLYSAADDGTVREWAVVNEETEEVGFSLPEFYYSLRTRQIDLSHSKLTALPNYLTKLSALDEVNLSNNQVFQY